MVASSFNRLPARLVREDGKVIELTVQEYDIAVERTHSAFGIPLSGGLKFGIDVNQPNVVIEMTGIITDDAGSLTSALGVGSEGTINFDFSRTIIRNGHSQSLRYLPRYYTQSPTNTGSIIYDEVQLDNMRLKIPFTGWEGDAVDSISVTFDGVRKGTKQEPYFYLNKERTMTGITLNGALSISAGSQLLTIPTNGDPREWLEVLNSPTSNRYSVKVGTGGTSVSGDVYSVSATQFRIVTPPTGSLTISDNSAISILKNDNITQHIDSQTGFPNMVIPVGDIIYPDSSYYTSGPNKPKDIGGPAGEIAYRLFKALSSTTSLGTKVSNADDNSTNIGKSSNSGSNLGALYVTRAWSSQMYGTVTNGRIKLLQRTKGPLHGLMSLPNSLISTTWNPLITNFSGGIDPITGTKSAGDKAQDLIGILSNSNNFNSTLRTEIRAGITALGLNNVFSNKKVNTSGDYINGLQLPYDSITTAGETENRVLGLVGAVPSGSETIITTGEAHELSVGTQISISNFYQGPNSTMAVDLTGDHTVASITNDYNFNISTASSSNTGSFSGDISYDLTKGNMGRKQRNFFVSNDRLTNNVSMEHKMSISNNVPASNPFNPNGTASRAAGIKGLVEAFEVEYNAAQKVYDFVIKFRVAKSIL